MKLWRGQPDHDHWKTRFTSGEKAVGWLGVGTMCMLLAFSDWQNPPQPPFTGKWRWLYSWIHSVFGPHGRAGLYLVVGLLLFVVAVVYWQQHRKQSALSGGRRRPNPSGLD